MTLTSRLAELEHKHKGQGKIICVYHDGDKWTHEGKEYTTAEWEAMREAEGSEDDTVLIISRDDRSPEEIRREHEHPQETRTTIQYPGGGSVTAGIDLDIL